MYFKKITSNALCTAEPYKSKMNFVEKNEIASSSSIFDKTISSIESAETINSCRVSIQIRLQHFNILKVIGEGAFGKG